MSYKKPIQRSLLIGCLLFSICLCVSLASLSWLLFSRSLYADCESRLRQVITFVEHSVDTVDLAECIHTRTPSEKFNQIQQQLNVMIDDFELYYLYIVIPVDTPEDEDMGLMMSVVSATSNAERAAGEVDYVLMEEIPDAYTKEMIDLYQSFWDAPDTIYFVNDSTFGKCYTGCKPLRTPDGTTIALLCADLPLNSLRHTVRTYVVSNLAMAVILCALFSFIMMLWLRHNVTGPVLALEKSTLTFARKSHDSRDPSQLSYDAPEIHTLNEVESLADAIARMSDDIKRYIEDMLYAEGRIRTAEQQVEGISRIAYQDALTHVKNKAACNEKMSSLSEVVPAPPEYAVVMVDLNCLKTVNDTYGHEKGDQYIIGACQIISAVFKRSPIYRIGGDEFVVVLQGEDYRNREELFRAVRDRFQEAENDTARAPWHRYSAAAGMAVAGAGEESADVLKRADKNMYENKQRMKKERGLPPAR